MASFFDNVDFAIETEQAQRRIGRLDAAGLERAADILRDMQRELVLKLAAAPTDYGTWFYSALLRDVERLSEEMGAKLAAQVNADIEGVLDVTDDTVGAGVQAVADKAGLSLYLPAVSRQSIEMLTGYVPGAKITGVADALKQQISSEIQKVLLGQTSPWELQQFLGANLDSAGPFKSIYSRAETIWRTESLRFFNAVAQERYASLNARMPGEFEKVWQHHNARNPRPHHLALHGQSIGIEDRFLVGGYEALYPHDPILPAKETVNCGCSHYIRPKGA